MGVGGWSGAGLIVGGVGNASECSGVQSIARKRNGPEDRGRKGVNWIIEGAQYG